MTAAALIASAGLVLGLWAVIDRARAAWRQRTAVEDALAIAAFRSDSFVAARYGAEPSVIPDHACSVRWEAAHLFPAAGAAPRRRLHRVDCPEPPIALVCPECDLRQPALHPSCARVCGYCGARLMTHGTRLYWWRDARADGDDTP